MPEWVEATGWIVLVDKDGHAVVPREQHTYEWSADGSGFRARHVSPHVFDVPRDRPAESLLVEDDAGQMIFGYRIPGGPITGNFLSLIT